MFIEAFPPYYVHVRKRRESARKQTRRIPLPMTKEQSRRNLITVVREIDFSEEDLTRSNLDPTLRLTSIKPLIEKFLTLENETWPEGHGFIAANYDPKSKTLEHISIGRVAESKDQLITFALVASRKSQSLAYIVKTSSPHLRTLLPKERQSNMMLTIPGDILVPYAPPLTTPRRI